MSAPLDFAALLSKSYEPARVSCLTPQEAYKPDETEYVGKPETKADTAKDQASHDLAAADDKLVMQLVSKTPEYERHVQSYSKHVVPTLEEKIPAAPTHEWETLPPALHPVELNDWEKQIQWDDVKEDEAVPKVDASTLLGQRRNPHLDALVFDDSNICWDGSPEDVEEKARRVPLILELGTAGQSVARSVLPVSRPTPFGQTDAYTVRYERELSTPATSTAELNKGTLHADKEQMELFIEQQRAKRTQMAIDKRIRVTEAMGTLSLGGGKGRTITSSLMGPGGTERTGRPSRIASSATHGVEYIEQLELVYNHVLVKPDLSKVQLRQYHRPRLPLNVVKVERPWQFQIRYVPSSKKTDSNTNSYQSTMMGSHAGALSQAKIRSEADLSPTEGDLVLLEYCEERPPIQLTKGMGSKIVNYYRGDKTRCPVSAGGGDRPTRRKRRENVTSKETNKAERSTRLVGPNVATETSLVDWIGKPPKKTRDDRAEKPSINVLPEGVTEILYHKAHGPFIGEVEDGVTQTGLITPVMVAPMFPQEAESTDFLMILGKKSPSRGDGQPQPLGVVLRPVPSSVFTVGQTEPRTKVFAPNSTGEKAFVNPFLSYQIAKALTRTENKEGHGLRFDEIKDHLFAYSNLPPTPLRQRIKQVAIYDNNTQIWTVKPIGMDDYPGVEALGRKFTPEGVAAYETACAAARRLWDLGLHELLSSANNVTSVGVTMAYLTGQMFASKELSRKMKRMLESIKTKKTAIGSARLAMCEKAATKLEVAWKEAKRRHEVAKFIYEELQLTPWHLTTEFIDVHRNGQGTGMMKLTGLGDPSGVGEGYSFLREVDTKASKGAGANTDGALNAQIKKITGTENDLRKLTMKQMASLLRSYGMSQQKIDTLKRWDRVHVIRDLSTKAASDGVGDGLERFARGEKMKLSEQKQMYRERIKEIWRRQRAALSAGDTSDSRAGGAAASAAAASVDADTRTANAETPVQNKDVDNDSDSESDDDEFAAMMEEDMMDVRQTNELVAAHARGGDGQRRAGDTQDVSKEDARQLAALQRERKEEQATQEGLLSGKPGAFDKSQASHQQSMVGKKVVRRRITKTHPDGRQTTVFKFVLAPEEVNKVMARKREEAEHEKVRKKKHEYKPNEKPVGHAMFEDEDDIDHKSRGTRFQVRTRTIKSKKTGMRGGSMHRPKLQLGKLKQKVSHESRIKKRKREAEEADLYVATSKRKGTNNRRERGSARDRMPHVILADRLEAIRSSVEKRPGSGPFHRPVSRRALPRYFEVISNPIDLQTIRDKNQRYEYRTAEAFLREFELMKNNAIKFNGQGSILGDEASAIYEFVKSEIADNRQQLDAMEEAVRDMGSKKKKTKTTKAKTKKKATDTGSNIMVDGVDLGELPTGFEFESSDSD